MNPSPTIRFNDPEWLTVSERLLDRLRGRINLIQPPAERRQVITETLEALCHEQGNSFEELLASDQVRRDFISYFLSYEVIEGFLRDPSIEDILINATEPIFVHTTGGGLVKTDKHFSTSRELNLFVNKLIVFGGRTDLEAINNIELADIRGRVNVVLSPFGPQITITRAKERPLSVLELISKGTLTPELAAQLWMYVEGLSIRPANLIIAGGPGSGKTTLLNALLCFIPKGERLVVIEDTFELNTQFLEQCSRLESYGDVTMATLVKNSLRMRPDRILVGEVRGEEARDLMTAMNVGKYCMGTLHASTARETIIRLENEPMNIPETLVNLVDVFVILRRFNIGGKVSRIVGELVETAGMEQRVVLLSPVWSYDYDRRQTVESSPSSIFRDRLAQASGLSAGQIMEETTRRAKVLKLMQDNPAFTDAAAMTQFCQLYVANAEAALAQLGTTLKALGKQRE